MSSTPGDRRSTPHDVDASTGPDELQVGPALRASRFPRWALALGAALLTLAVVAGAGFAAWRWNTSRPDQVVVGGGPSTPWALTPPLRVGDYSRSASAVDTPSVNPTSKKQTLATTYSRNGVNSVVLLTSRPEKDAKKFLGDMAMNTVVATGDGYCGTTVDTNRDGCAIIRDDTAVLVVDLVGLTRTDLMDLTHTFADSMSH